MNTTKTLMLAAFAAMSLGVGSAMAQEGGLSVGFTGYGQPPATSALAPASNANQVQSGSSDVEKASPHTAAPNWNSSADDESIGVG
jgi:hypothetical protein